MLEVSTSHLPPPTSPVDEPNDNAVRYKSVQ